MSQSGITSPKIPPRSTSLTGTIELHYQPMNDESPSSASKKTLKRTASGINKFQDPEGWWQTNDSLIRIDLDEEAQIFHSAKAIYEGGGMTKVAWEATAIKCLSTMSSLRESLAALAKERNQLNGALSAQFELSPAPSRHFTNLLLEFLEGQQMRSSRKQSEFRRSLLEAHQAWGPNKNSVFCPVLGQFIDPNRVKAAHIYPYLLGTTVMRLIFGDASVGELFHTRNGLLLSDTIESRFDRHQLAIIPAPGARIQPDGSIDRWVIRLLDDSIKEIPVSESIGTMENLHDRELVFRTSARPASRYLYFHFLVALLHTKKHGRKVYQPQVETNESAGGKPLNSLLIPWAMLGSYMKENMVRAFIATVGHDVLKERDLEDIMIPDDGATPSSAHMALAEHLVSRNPDETKDPEESREEEV